MKLLHAFLREIGLHPDCISLPDALVRFQNEIAAGLAGSSCSLGMHPTFLAARPPEPHPAILCLDCGGTYLRWGLVHFSEQQPIIENYCEAPMPGTEALISPDSFFERLAAHIRPLARPGLPIGFCFSYPMDILPNRDGRLLRLTKELKVPALPGHCLGKELLARLPPGCGPTILLNDTVATLLGGIPHAKAAGADGLAGMILGTGFNCCYAAQGATLTKLPGSPNMIINLECGNYDQPQGQIDKLLDADTDIPGAGLLEKMIGGAYHPQLLLLAARTCAQSGFFSPSAKAILGEISAFSAQDLEQLSLGKGPLCTTFPLPKDQAILRELLHQSQIRAAKLITMVLTALAIETGGGQTTAHPFCVVVDGSAFYGSHFLQAALSELLNTYTTAERGLHIRLLHASHSNLLGAAAAAWQACL